MSVDPGRDRGAWARAGGAADLNERSNPPEPRRRWPSPRAAAAAAAASAAWVLPLAFGAALRVVNLDRQILLDDELHTVLSALYLSMGDILSTWKTEDPCLPLTAFYRALLVAGVPFSEMTFRAPAVAASLATILAVPRLALPWIGRRAAILLAWLVALSPILAFYGGMVRPYAFIALLAPAATLALLRWRDGGGLRWGLGYAALAALCLWFHLATAPLLAVPFGLLALEKLFSGRRGAARLLPRQAQASGAPDSPRSAPRWRDFAVVGGATLLLIGAFVAPTWGSLHALYAAKRGGGVFTPDLVAPILELQAGTATPAAAALFWALALVGLAALWRLQPIAVVVVAGSTLAQWVGLAILAPIGLGNPLIFNRYLIGTLPLMLLLLAIGLDLAARRLADRLRLAAASRGASPRSARFATAALLTLPLVLLAALGPFADPEVRRSSFRHSKDFVRFDVPRGRMAEEAVPAFYRSEEVIGSSAPIAEFPFRGGWSATRAHYVYQTVHRAPVIAIEPFPWPCDERLRLRNHHCARPRALPASEARFLVVHRDPLAEERLVEGGDASGNDFLPEDWERTARLSRRVARNLRRIWGPPSYTDERLLVWDLDRVRALGASEVGGAEAGSEAR